MEVAELFAAFQTLRTFSDSVHPEAQKAWNTLFSWIRTHCGRDPDLHQEVLLAVIRHHQQCTATEPLVLAKWISTIYSRKRIDAFRRAKHERKFVTIDGTGGNGDDQTMQFVAPEVGSHGDALLFAFIETTQNAFLSELPQDLRRERRTLLSLQVRLALLRELLDFDLDALRAEVPAILQDEPLKADRLYKWVERGRVALTTWLALPPEGLDIELRQALAVRLAKTSL